MTEEVRTPHTPALSHLAPLDGLRGMAVLLVMIDHFSFGFLTRRLGAIGHFLEAGWIGVDLFFVLSGYLITRGLARATDRSVGARLKLFWMRRVLRIFPLYYIVTLVGAGLCLAYGAHEQMPDWTFWVYLQNYSLALRGGELLWMAHFWSLAIEEQFYMLWPLVVLLAPRRARVGLALGGAAASFGLRAVLALSPGLVLAALPAEKQELGWVIVGQMLYRMTPTRLDGLLLGACLAFFENDPTGVLARAWNRVRVPMLWASGALLVLLIVWTRGFIADDRRVVLIGYSTCAVFFASAVSLASTSTLPRVLMRAFTSRVLSACGKVSYGMYLFHFPLVFLLSPRLLPWLEAQSMAVALLAGGGTMLACALVTYGLAVLSFRFVEEPFLGLKSRFHD